MIDLFGRHVAQFSLQCLVAVAECIELIDWSRRGGRELFSHFLALCALAAHHDAATRCTGPAASDAISRSTGTARRRCGRCSRLLRDRTAIAGRGGGAVQWRSTATSIY